MKKDWNAVEVLRYSRHDWLNKLQLIKGNISLNKLERVNQIIDEIIIDAKHESDLSNLKTQDFASFLMTHNWENHFFTIEYEVLGKLRNISQFDQELTSWCYFFFKKLNESVDQKSTNHLCLSIDFNNNETKLFLDFSGIISHTEALEDWMNEQEKSHPSIHIIEKNIHNKELTLVFQLVQQD